MKKYLVLIILLTSMGWAKICGSKLFTFSIPSSEKVSLNSILKEIAINNCNINIVYDDEMTKSKVENLQLDQISVKNYSFLQILDLLVTNNNFFYTIKNNILHISYIKTKTFNIDYIPSTRTGNSNFSASTSGSGSSSSNTGDKNSVNSKYTFDFWNTLSGNLKSILNSDTANIIIDKNAGLVTITATKKQLSKIENYINKLNSRLHKQIMIDAKIYEVHLSKNNQTGINWSNLNISLDSSNNYLTSANIIGSGSIFSKSLFNVSGFLNFLATQGNVNSISNPKIVALNNQKSILSVGDNINYKYPSKVVSTATSAGSNTQTEYTYGSKFVGILIDITPEISDNDDIILRVNPTVSTFRDLAQLSDKTRDLAPDTSENKMTTVVRIKDGDTLVLGGLITNRNSLQRNGVPILKEIPVIKYLFSSKSQISDKEELVFVITPHIVRDNKKTTIKDLGY
jgi:general secretion pathway protein D